MDVNYVEAATSSPPPPPPSPRRRSSRRFSQSWMLKPPTLTPIPEGEVLQESKPERWSVGSSLSRDSAMSGSWLYRQSPPTPKHKSLDANMDPAATSPKVRSETAESHLTIHCLGDRDCNSCISRPTHNLVPCQHTVCYDHLLLGHDAESSVPTFCGRCNKVFIFSRLILSTSPSLTPYLSR